jgi:putative N6-adenine-specific DNA methylase
MKLLATTLQGLEDVLESEIKGIGGSEIKKLKRAVLFSGSRYTLYAANLYLKTAIRILVPILEVKIKNENELYDAVKNIEWEKHFNTSQTFAVFGVTSSAIFRHSKYAALKSKDAIADRFREIFNRRPDVDVEDPDFVINIHIRNETLTVSLDSSGKTLHMRGYRKMSVEAPLSENLASGLLYLLEWNKQQPFYDPMCGSGTLLAEAYILSSGKPTQNNKRNFAFKNWRDFSPDLYDRVVAEFSTQAEEHHPDIYGSDIDPKAIDTTKYNLSKLPGCKVALETKDFINSIKPAKNGCMIINPPYDERLILEDIVGFYGDLGQTLKTNYKGWKIGIISSNENAMRNLGLRPTKSYKLKNGPIDVNFTIFEIYE